MRSVMELSWQSGAAPLEKPKGAMMPMRSSIYKALGSWPVNDLNFSHHQSFAIPFFPRSSTRRSLFLG
jgi:hypothetical protein